MWRLRSTCLKSWCGSSPTKMWKFSWIRWRSAGRRSSTMDLNEGICSHKVQVTCCFFLWCCMDPGIFFSSIFSDAAVYSLYISCNSFLPVYFQRSQLLLLLLLVQEVQNHAEIPEFCQRPPSPLTPTHSTPRSRNFCRSKVANKPQDFWIK